MILELIPASDDVETEGLDSCGIVRKEGLSIPVRALSFWNWLVTKILQKQI